MLFNPGEMMPTIPRSFSDPVMESSDRLQVSSSRSNALVVEVFAFVAQVVIVFLSHMR